MVKFIVKKSAKKIRAKKAAKKPKPKTSNLGRKGITPATLAQLVGEGYSCQKVEYWNSFAKPFGKRVDFFNCIDVIGCHGIRQETIGVQSTSRKAVSARLKKIRELFQYRVKGNTNRIEDWLRAGNKLEVWGWDKSANRRRVLKVRLALTVSGELIEKERVELT